MAPTGCPARDSCAPKLSDHRRVSSKAVSRFACHTHSIPVLLTCGRCMECVGQGRASELSVRPPVEHAPGTPSPGNAEPRERRAPARREPALQAKFFDFPHPQPASGSAAQKRHGVEPVPLFEIAVKLRSRARIFVGCSGVSMTADDHESPMNPLPRQGSLHWLSAVIDTPLQDSSDISPQGLMPRQISSKVRAASHSRRIGNPTCSNPWRF